VNGSADFCFVKRKADKTSKLEILLRKREGKEGRGDGKREKEGRGEKE